MSERTPKDALRHAMHRAIRYAEMRRDATKPGAVIEAMSEEDRRLLKELSSDDFKDVWRDVIPDEPPHGSPAWNAMGWEYTLKAILEGRYK